MARKRYLKCKWNSVLGGTVVFGKSLTPLGAFYDKGEVFWRSRVFKPLEGCEWTANCLRELADHMDKAATSKGDTNECHTDQR